MKMKEIRKLLEKEGVAYSDGGYSWRDKPSTSAYKEKIEETVKSGKTSVFVELAVDSPVPENTVNVDHHMKMPLSRFLFCRFVSCWRLGRQEKCNWWPPMTAAIFRP